MLSLYVLLSLLLQYVRAGFVLPDQPNPIIPYRNNELAYGEYVFYVSFATRIVNNAQIQIVFPQEYDPTTIVNNTTPLMTYNDTCPILVQHSQTSYCPQYSPQGNFGYNPAVIVADRTVLIYIPTNLPLNAGSYKITIKYNQNPKGYGGQSTGDFKIRSYYQSVLVDSNENFGTIGFAPQYISYIFNDTYGIIQNDGSNLGGYVTNYVISFNTTVFLQATSQFRLEFADGFDISQIVCYLKDNNFNLGCTTVGQRVYFQPTNIDLLPGAHKIQLRNVKNPFSTGLSGTFIFETLQPYVNTVVEYYLLNPVYILPGQIINPSVAANPLNENLRVVYTCKFTPMNVIPTNGKIVYTFPPGYQLDPTCSINYGLSPQTTNGLVSCTTSGLTITITNFAMFTSQEISFNIFATNPSVSQIYQPFTIQSFSTFGSAPLPANYKQIDQNMNAGQIQISSIESPYFVAIDMYRTMVNLTLDQTGPIDFRVYPNAGHELQLTAGGAIGEISIQIPLWWRLQSQTFTTYNIYGNTPTCMFGAETSSLCQYKLQFFKFDTASATNYPKFPTGMGLGQCDLPISLSNVRITPIPGRWDFRVITMIGDTYTNFATQPQEQDLYTMDIPPDLFPSPTSVVCTGKDQVDNETVCYANIRIGLPIPYEGAINFNMSTVNNTYQSVSAWPNDLGFNLANDGKTNIPCTIVINGQTVGYAGTFHPNVKCYAFAGSVARTYAILQVKGFSSLIATGTTVFIVIPDITSCTAYDLNCFITLTSAYTAELDIPYTLNYLIASVALVVKGSISKDVTTAVVTSPTTQSQDTILKADFNNLIEICTATTWTFTFTNLAGTAISPASGSRQADNILIKIPRARFVNNGIPIFSLTGAASASGNVYVIDNFRTDINMIYFFVIITSQVANGSPNSFSISNIINAVDYTPGIVTKMVYWVNQRRISRITYPISKPWLNGGILNPYTQILPKPIYNPANRQESIDMDFNSQIVFMVSFQTCHQVLAGGLIEVQIQSGLVSSLPTCLVWSGVTSPPLGLGFTQQCNRVEVPVGSGNFFYQITLFDSIPPMTKITISFRGTTGLTAVASPPITINSYYSAAIRASSPNNAANVNDFYRQTFNAISVTGPKIFPNKLMWMPFYSTNIIARQYRRGEFYMFVNYTFAIPSYNTDQNPRLVFTFNSSAIGMSSTPICRLDGNICPVCYWNGAQIYMSMSANAGLTKYVNSLVVLSTRGADGSASTREGFNFSLAGRFQLKVETLNTGNSNEFTYLVMDIQPTMFWYYWVWASSKIGVDPINNDPIAPVSLYRVYFTNPVYIPPANNPDPVTITLQFFRVLPPTFTNGYEQDLGTGFPHRYDLPCIHKGFNLLPGKTKPKCRLFIGSYPNPTQIIITDFAAIPSWSNCEIHIPQIFNPNSTLQLTSIGLTASLVLTASGATIPLMQNTYSLINNTFGRTVWNTQSSPATPQISVDVKVLNKLSLMTAFPAAVNPTFTQTTIDTLDNFQLQWVSKDQQMGGGADCVIFTLPSLWNLPYGNIPCNFPMGGVTCVSYPNAHQVALFLTSTVPKGTLVTGTINIKTPPFKILVSASDPPIQIYIYTRSKLVDIYNVQFTQVMVAVPVVVKVTVDQPYFSQLAQYTINIVNLKNIPQGGTIQITLPSQLSPREYGCRNDLIGGSQLSQIGFGCQIVGQNLLINGFSNFVGPGQIQILIRMLNPASPTQVTDNWVYNSYYLNENPLNKLITYGQTTSPTLTVPTQIFYWDTPYLSRTRQVEQGYGSIELRLILTQATLSSGSALIVTLPFNMIGCMQFLCLWDPTPWFDNHNDNWLTAQQCVYNPSNSQLSVYTPIGVNIVLGTVYRLIIDTQNHVSGQRGFQLPAYGYQSFTVQTATEMIYAKAFIPKLTLFTFFECYSLVTNVNFKNMFSIKFQPTQAIPSGGYLIMYVPTANEYGYPLFDNDLGSGKVNLGAINCYPRSGFVVGTNISCTITHGMQLLGLPVKITIKGTWTASLTTASTFVVEVDEFRNPNILGDNNHIEQRLESYDNSNNLLDMSLSYDMTLKTYAYATGALAMPLTSTNVVLDNSVTYDLQITTSVALTNAWLYDWFVVEFTKPVYLIEPQTILCKSGASVACTVTQGHNWVIMDVQDLAAMAQQHYTLTNVNNPVILPTAGVVLTGYAIRDRIVMGVYTYAPMTTFVVAVSGSTTTMFVITPMDYLPTQIPFSTIIRYRVQIKVSDKCPGTTLGAVVDLILPTGYVAYPNCINDVTGGSQMTTTTQNYLSCSVNPSILTKFVGRQNLSFTGFDAMAILQNMTIIIYAQTPSAAIVAPQWDYKCYQSTSRAVQLFDGLLAGPDVQNYPSFTDFTWTPMMPKTIRVNSYAPLVFNLVFPTAVSNANSLVITLPSSASIQVPTGATLHCTITSGANRYTSSVCIPTGSPVTGISMQFPLEPASLPANLLYSIEVNTVGADLVRGLSYLASGKFQAGLAIGATTGSLFFEVLPASSFTNANIKVINALHAQLTGFLVSFKTTVIIPQNGKIIVGFPTKSLDGTIIFFADDLTSSVQSSGSVFTCSATMASLVAQTFDCRIYKNKGFQPRTEISIQNFPSAIAAGSTLSFVIENIQITYAANQATIPLELYTIDANANKLESMIFYDWVSPIATTALYGQAMTVTFATSQTAIQKTASTYTFSNINVGSLPNQITPSSMIIFIFPKGQNDLTSVSLAAGTTTNCLTNGLVQTIANYVIYTQPTTPASPCTGSGLKFVLGGIVNPISTAPLQYQILVCLERACAFSGQNAAYSFVGTTAIQPTHTPISDLQTFPRSCVNLTSTMQMNVNLPVGSQIVVWYPDTTLFIDRIEAFGGIGSFSIQRALVTGQQQFTLTLNKPYFITQGNIAITLYGQLKSNIPATGNIYQIGFYTRYQLLPVNLDVGYPTFSKVATAGFTAINQATLPFGYINTLNVIPGQVGVDSIIHMTLPTLTIPASSQGNFTYRYLIEIEGVSLSSSVTACAINWVVTTIPATPVPNCTVVQPGKIDIGNVPFAGTSDPMAVEINTFKFATSGQLAVTVQFYSQNSGTGVLLQLGVYYGYTIIQPSTAISPFSPSFVFLTNNLMSDNIMTIDFTTPSSVVSGTLGALYLDILSPITTTLNYQRKILCQVTPNTGVSTAQCTWLPQARLSQSTTSYDGFANVLNSRILIQNYQDISASTSATVTIYFDQTFTTTVNDHTNKHFQFGYYLYTGFGNKMNYQFGENFVQVVSSTSVTSTTKSMSLSGSVQGIVNMQFTVGSGSGTISSGDQIYIKFKDGYHMALNSNNYVKPGLGSPPSVTVGLLGGSCNFEPSLAMLLCTYTNVVGSNSVTVSIGGMEQPFLPSGISKIASIYAIQQTTLIVYAAVDYSVTGSLTPAAITNALVTQYDTKLFYLEFQLPTTFQAFNNYDCAPGTCMQSLQIVSTSFPDFDSYDIRCGINTALTFQQYPTINSQMVQTFASNKLTFNGFSLITGSNKVCLWVRTISAPTSGGSQQFTFNILHNTIVTATASVNIAVSSTVPTGTLIGYIPSQFGYMDYYEKNANYQMNSQGYLVFRFTLGFVPQTGGKFKLMTTALNLATYGLSDRPRCFFRDSTTRYLSPYAALGCTVDRTNLWILVPYSPAVALTTTTQYELVIIKEQTIQPLFSMPSTAVANNITVSYLNAAGAIQALSMVTLNTYQKQSTKVNYRNFVGHAGSQTLFQLNYTVSYPTPSTAFINVEFPLADLVGTTLQTYFPNGLGTGIPHGFQINCLDKMKNLGNAYTCQLFQGITTYQRITSYVQISGINALNVGDQVSINIMNFQVPPTVNGEYSIRLKVADNLGNNYEYYPIYDAIYVLSAYGGSPSNKATASMTPSTTNSVVDLKYQLATTSTQTASLFSTVLFSYNSDLWGQDYTVFKATVAGCIAQIDPMSPTSAFITFPQNQGSGTNIAIDITSGLKTPLYSGAFTSVCNLQWINYLEGQVSRYVTNTISTTLTQSTSMATPSPLTQSSYFQGDPGAIIYMAFQTQMKLNINTAIIVTFPSGFVVTSNTYCQLWTGTHKYNTSTVYDPTNRGLKVTILEAIPTTTNIVLWAQVTLPTTVATYTVTFSYYKDNTYTQLYQTFTLSSVTLIPYYKMYNTGMYPIYNPQILLQATEIGPLRLTFTPTVQMTQNWDYVVIDSSFISTILDYPVQQFYEVRCFWNDMAAMMCFQNLASKTITVYRPSSTTINVGTQYTIFVSLWRAQPLGVIDFTYLWTPITTGASIKNVPLTSFAKSGSQYEQFKKNIPLQNYRFNILQVVMPGSVKVQNLNYISVHQGTINTNTLINIHFKLPQSLLSALGNALGTSWGRIILNIPTKDDWYLQAQFPDGFGRFTQNAQQIDCNCNICPAWYVSLTPLFICTVYLGFQDKDAPSQIWIDPQQNLNQYDVFDITFPKIKLPPTTLTYAKMSLIAFQYNAANKVITNISEIIHDFTFQTSNDAFPVQTGVSPPTFSPDIVGNPANVNWIINNPYANIQSQCHDRWVLQTEDPTMIFEHPFNPVNNMLYTTATQHTVVIYTLAKWVEFIPTVTQTQSATAQTLQAINLKNMPYQIPAGVVYTLYLYVGIGLRSQANYTAKATAAVGPLFFKSLTPIPMALVLQPNQYQLVFESYNKIPMTGMIILDFPNYDWTFTDAYCQVTSGLVDCACNLISTTKQIQIANCIQDYDPLVNGKINMQFNINNPSTAQTAIYFKWRSYWDMTQTWLIDQDNAFESNPTNTITAGGILRVQLFERYEHPFTICGGIVGPISLTFNLAQGSLYYPNDFILLAMWSAFQPATGYQEIICYFNDPSNLIIVNIKSHRCDWDPSTNGGQLSVYIPEEVDIMKNKDWLLVLTSRGSPSGDGWLVRSPSDSYWVTFSTSTTLDKGWFEAVIPGCPFANNVYFNCENIGWQASPLTGTPAWSIFNFTASTQFNNIPAGDTSVAGYSRFLFEFLTHNEISTSFPMDITNRMAPTDQRAELACNGLIKGNNKPLQAQGNSYIKCMNIKATGNAWNNTPSYVTVNFYEQIAAGQRFHLQLAQFMNGYVVGAAAHIKINMQVLKMDGTFYAQNEHYCWNAPAALYAAPTPVATSSASLNRYYSQVAWNMGVSTFQVNLNAGDNLIYGDAVVYQYSYPYFMPSSGFCNQSNTAPIDWAETACTPQPFNLWFVIANNFARASSAGFIMYEMYHFVNPSFIFEDGNPKSGLQAYVWRQHRLIYNLTLPYQSPTKGVAYVVLQTTQAENPHNQWVKYHVGFFMYTQTVQMTHIRLWAPNDFQNITNCTINRGLVLRNLQNINSPVTCVITKINPGDTTFPNDGWMIEIDNFAPYQGDGWMIFDMLLFNPLTPRWTKGWRASTFQSKANLTYRIDDNNYTAGGQTWSGKQVRQPNLFRVWRNTISFENRRAQTDEYAELDLRILPREVHPPTDTTNGLTEATNLEIWMPLSFNIPNGGQTVCDFGQQYHQDLGAQQCQITSDRKILMNTDRMYGIKPNCTQASCLNQKPASTACQLVTATTVNAIGKNGFKLPSIPGPSTFQVFLSSQATTGAISREYNYLSGSAAPQQLNLGTDPNFLINSLIREVNQQTIVKVRFTVPLGIPAGYDTTPTVVDPLSKNPIGYIVLSFNTHDFVNYGYNGFPLNLGTSGPAYNLLCQAFSQLVPQSGGKLQCTVTPSTRYDINYPVIVTVSNFQYIFSGSVIEIDLLYVLNGWQFQNNGKVDISAYQVAGDGTITSLIMKTSGYIPLYDNNALRQQFLIDALCPLFSDVTITPQLVGAYTQITINNLFLNNTFNAGDRFSFKFPPPFQFPKPTQPSQQISGSWDGIQLITTVYPDIQTIIFELPPGVAVQIDVAHQLKISQLVNAAYAFTSLYSIHYVAIKQGYRTYECDITNIQPPLVAPTISQQMTVSSTFSGDVYVTYNFTFTPSYLIPKGSTVKISLPSRQTLNYNQISNSNPPVVFLVCDPTVLSLTSISPTALTINTLSDISSNSPLYVTLTGAKNPNFVGATINNDFALSITHPNGFLINQQSFAPFTFFSKKNVGVIYMTMLASNLFRAVSSDYTFTLQSSTFVPPNGLIQLKLPIAWASILPTPFAINQLSGSWTTTQLSYSATLDKVSDPNNYLLNIVNNFAWPSRNSLTIQIFKLLNPNITQTNIFQAQTYYDNLPLDQTDPTDQSLEFAYKSFAQGITVVAQSQSPSNQGEVSTFNFSLQSPSDIPSGGSIQLQFPSTFSPTLSTYDKTVSCILTFSDGTSITTACTALNRQLSIPITTLLPKGKTFQLSIVGIANPNLDTSAGATPPQIDILTLNQQGQILQYTNNASQVHTTAAPQTMAFTSLSSDSYDLQTKANYTLCVTTSQPIPIDAQVYIDFPQQFQLRQSSYPCNLGAKHDQINLPYSNKSQSPTCKVTNSLRRIAVSGQLQAYAGMPPASSPAQLCYVIRNVENPSSAGPTNNFQVSIFNKSSNQIMYQTFGTLSANTTLSYQRQGLQIVVGMIAPIANLTSSPQIQVTLQRAVSYPIILTPMSNEFIFTPTQLVFLSQNGPTVSFRISAINDSIPLGQKSITWMKVENTSVGQLAQFSEVADSYFQYIYQPQSKSLILSIYPIVSRAALLATSLPITLTLSQPASLPLTVVYSVPQQSNNTIVFNPQIVVFQPGQTTQTLTYTTQLGALSGAINFRINEIYYTNVYYMPNQIVNFEILQEDNRPPIVINYYAVNIGRTQMYFRASIDKTVNLFYEVILRGSVIPSFSQIFYQNTVDTVWKAFGSNYSYQSVININYVYNDVYLAINGLTEQTDYTLFFFVKDLSGNNNSQVITFNFTTLQKQLAADFQITLQGNVPISKLLQAFGLATGLTSDRFEIIANPPVYTIPGATEPEVLAILAQQTTTYTIRILPSPTLEGKSPLQYVAMIDQNKDLIKTEIPQLVTSVSIINTAFEVIQYPQEFRYTPFLVNVTEQQIYIQASIRYTGMMYSILLPIAAPKPSSKQISMGMDSTNTKLPRNRRHMIMFSYAQNTPSNTQVLIDVFQYPMLFDNSYYTVYFTANNDLPVNPDLLPDSSIQQFNFKTLREVIIIPKKYVHGHLLGSIIMSILLIVGN